MIICSCNVLSDKTIRSLVELDGVGPRSLSDVYNQLGCSASCGRCAAGVLSAMREARSMCASQCGSCAARDIECSVHASSVHANHAVHETVAANTIAA